MAAGIKILSMIMSFVIVSISEITPWVFSNESAAENSVLLDAACFDSVLSIPSEEIFAAESVSVTEQVSEVSEPATEIFAEETTFTVEKAATTASSEAKVTVAEKVSETEVTEAAETTEPTEESTAETTEEVSDAKNMLWPVGINSMVVSGYPAYANGAAHHGIDIFVSYGDGRTRDDNGNSLSYGKPFRAAEDGTVVEVYNDGNWNTGFGNYCIVDHGDGTQTLYAHAKTVYVQVGDYVKQGQTLGEIGDTGNTTAPHLHFEVRVNSSRVNPLNYVVEP